MFTRRHFLQHTGTGLGMLGLAALCDDTAPQRLVLGEEPR